MIITLQERIAYQDEEITRLSDELYAQQKDMADLRRELKNIASKIDQGESESNIRPVSEETPPPHY